MKNSHREGMSPSDAIFVSFVPILGSALLFFTDELFNGDIRKISIITFSPSAYMAMVATLINPNLKCRLFICSGLSTVPYFLFSLAVYLSWKYNLAEFGQLTGFLIGAILLVISFFMPFIFFSGFAVGTGFFPFVGQQIKKIPIRILPSEGNPSESP